ncbi:endonuclease/exonuclease/phosphatase family protein [Spirosoma sp. SC4-14]|uniref:endonuclease/exonuclease/phosphatase family protein n=1 Tax=Spirosoma sp. SC4-14 TaxID=3128900 RepID=UPI0030D503C4
MTVSTPSRNIRSRSSRILLNAQTINRWLTILSISLAGCALVGKLLGQLYFFELFSHFAIQYEWLSYGFLAFWLIYRRSFRNAVEPLTGFVPIGLLLITAYVSHTTWTPGDYSDPIPAPQGDVRVLHANVLYSREEYRTTVAMVTRQNPDLYVLQEMTPDPIRFVTSQLRTEYPYWFACRSKQQVWTLVGSRTRFRVEKALALQQHIISLTTQIRGKKMALVTVHPHTPVIPSWFRERNTQLTRAAHETRTGSRPTVLIGDFNISPFSPIYKTIFQAENSTAEKGALVAARTKKTQPTWPRFFPPMMIPIDHAFVNAGFKPQLFRTLYQPGSDHRAIVVDLTFN